MYHAIMSRSGKALWSIETVTLRQIPAICEPGVIAAVAMCDRSCAARQALVDVDQGSAIGPVLDFTPMVRMATARQVEKRSRSASVDWERLRHETVCAFMLHATIPISS